MSTTTIKVSSDLRDRLNQAASHRGLSTGHFVEELLASYQRQQWFAAVRESYADASTEDLETYQAETAAWDEIAADGFGDA